MTISDDEIYAELDRPITAAEALDRIADALNASLPAAAAILIQACRKERVRMFGREEHSRDLKCPPKTYFFTDSIGTDYLRWLAGDKDMAFSAIEGWPWSPQHRRLLDVQVERAEIEALIAERDRARAPDAAPMADGEAPIAAQPAAPAAERPPARRGRPPKYDWRAFDAEVVRIIDVDSAPGPDGGEGWTGQADLARRMAEWCERAWRAEPSNSMIKARLSGLLSATRQGR